MSPFPILPAVVLPSLLLKEMAQNQNTTRGYKGAYSSKANGHFLPCLGDSSVEVKHVALQMFSKFLALFGW